MAISAVALTSIIAWNNRSGDGDIPKLKIPEVGAETNIEQLEVQIPTKQIKELEQVKKAPVYKYVLPKKEKIISIADKLGCDMKNPDRDAEYELGKGTNEKGDILYFTYEPGNGCWNWVNQTVQEKTKGKNLPSDQQCQEQAIAKLKELGIYQTRFNTLQVEPETGINEQDEETTVAKTLLFYPEIDGQVVEGVSRIIVSFGDNGEIYEISKYYKDFVEVKEKEVISVNAALKKVDQGDAMFTLGETVEKAALNNAVLTYWEDPRDIDDQSYLQPVWVFEGESAEADAANKQFEAIVPALK